MNYVEPIRDIETVKTICSHLKETNSRNYMMFIIGIYSGLRISDILKLRVADVKNKNSINLREKKTKKQKIFEINPFLKKEIKLYCENKQLNEYLIQSREGGNKSLGRVRAYQVMRAIGDRFGIPDLGTHTLRKTFGYLHYKQYEDIALLMDHFNHSSQKITLRYIGIEQEEINKSIKYLKIL